MVDRFWFIKHNFHVTVENSSDIQRELRPVSNCAVNHEVVVPEANGGGEVGTFDAPCIEEKLDILRGINKRIRQKNGTEPTFAISCDVSNPDADPCIYCTNIYCTNIREIT